MFEIGFNFGNRIGAWISNKLERRPDRLRVGTELEQSLRTVFTQVRRFIRDGDSYLSRAKWTIRGRIQRLTGATF